MGNARNVQGSLLILLSAAGFGALSIFAKVAYAAGANVVTTLFLRFLVAWVLLWGGLGLTRAARLPVSGRVVAACIGLGALGYTAQSLTFFTALRYIPASLTALVHYIYPLVVTLLAWVILHERIDRRKGLALGAAVTGLVLILWRGINAAAGVGVMLALLSAGVYSTYIILGRLTLRGVPSFASAAIIIPSACMSFGLYGGLSGQLSLALPARAYAAIGGMAVISTVLAIVAFFAGLERVGASRTAILSTFEPVVTIALGVSFLGEWLTAGQIVGGACILGAVLLLSRSADGEHSEME